MMDSPPDPVPDQPQRRSEAELERRRHYRQKYQAAHPERARQQHLKSQRRAQERLKIEKAHRASERARVRQWAAANPGRDHERKRAWNEQNPERVREQKRNYYHRNQEQRQHAAREQNTQRRQDPGLREQERHYQAARQHLRNAQQNERRSSPEARQKHNVEQNERRRRNRRRRQLGLPPRPSHRVTINERESNATAARQFFARRRGAREIRLLREEGAEVRALASLSQDAFWREDLEARIRADAAKPARIAAAVDMFLATKGGARLREEIRMDSIARELHGAAPYPDAEAEARRRVLAALAARRSALIGIALPTPGPSPTTPLAGRAAVAL
jgi:hypothetical protein